jgi:16S rRNA (cytosine967-C5)-methyltransferase
VSRPQAARSRQTSTPTTDVPGLAARQAAARLLAAVVDANTSLDGLTDPNGGHPMFRALEPRDRALVKAILITALRFRSTIDALLSARLDRPLPPNASALQHVLHVAAAQVLFLDVPDRAAVDLAVTQARHDPRTTRFANLVNALLRGLARERETALPQALDSVAEGPNWFRDMLVEAYGGTDARAMLAMHRHPAAIDLTVRADLALWAERLGGVVLPNGTVRLRSPEGAVADLAGFAEGAWWVQDAAASLPARMFGDVTGQRVADLCAAPGGKTAQLAAAGAKVTALDISANRLRRLAGNLERLGLGAETVQGDLAAYAPAHPFDAVLLDAPCSSSGTVRRHPDVPWTKSPEEVAKLARVQRRLLDHAAAMVRPGGLLVFSNCSLFPIEGEAVVADFLKAHPDYALDPVRPGEIAGADDFIRDGMLRTTPLGYPNDDIALAGLDGFFAARLRRAMI